MGAVSGVPHRCSYCDRYGHKRPTCPVERAERESAAADVAAVLILTKEERDAVATLLGHALDQAHDDQTRAYLQDLIDNEYENATESREVELEALVGGVLDRLTKT